MTKNGFRMASKKDIKDIVEIYDKIHSWEEKGKFTISWKRNIYPVEATAITALEQGELFVYEEEGRILGTAIINRSQNEVYKYGRWNHFAEDKDIMVLHTLAVCPDAGRNGIGRGFINFYEQYAKDNGCSLLRLDTSEKNIPARNLYAKQGYREAGIVPCNFNGIGNVNLVLLEKKLQEV